MVDLVEESSENDVVEELYLMQILMTISGKKTWQSTCLGINCVKIKFGMRWDAE